MCSAWNLGARWHRWEPHIHAPGTLRNNQFGDEWDAYIRLLEQADPRPAALGITDYFTMRSYKEVLRRRKEGALDKIPLVFANIELRLTLETKEGQGINLHLLVSPDDPHHVERMEAKLSRLEYPYRRDRFPCTDEGLTRLGRAHRNDEHLDEAAARSDGANQFKVELDRIRELFDREPWMRENVLVAVAAGNDGLAGIPQETFHAQREELGRFAQIVFSGNPKDRDYWLGNHRDFKVNGQTPKPCLHGCDAHKLEDVLRPAHERRCWIRAQPTFEGLRQTLAEPERRVHIGSEPPEGAPSSEVVRALHLHAAPTFENEHIDLNDGLVTIIGARGSGKTALADLLALGADADEAHPGDASFIRKAGDLLHGLEAEVEWADGNTQTATLPREPFSRRQPRVRYLSQQFVEALCSPSEFAEPLNEEIEHVVFSAIPEEERMQCHGFAELRDVMLADPRAEQNSQREIIRDKTSLIADETKLKQSVLALRNQVQESERKRKALEDELAKIPVKGNEETVNAHAVATASLTALREAMAALQRREQNLRDLTAEVRRQERAVGEEWNRTKTKYGSVLEDAQWLLLRPQLDNQAIATLTRLEAEAKAQAEDIKLRGLPRADTAAPAEPEERRGLVALTERCKTLGDALGLDKANVLRRAEIDRVLPISRNDEQQLRQQLVHAEKAGGRIKEIHAARLQAYEELFAAVVAEETALQALYKALQSQLQSDPAQKLSFVVERAVDLKSWTDRGEELFDLRRQPFSGRGSIAELARTELLHAWQTGSPAVARAAVAAFFENHVKEAMSALAQDATPLEVGEWLFSTEHIAVRYSIRYEGMDLGQLSPGTRGVVLLTLYLALDQWDSRPLVIDQPEENLDPRSVYKELVPFFRKAALRRQIIMVTHNANLVVNTDSDQVIIATATRRSPAELPTVRYIAGGLEDSAIRTEVCQLLEGGIEAFRKRRERYARPADSD